MTQPIIEIRSTTTRQPQYQLVGLENLTINRGEQIAIVGGNGAGKSILVGILTGAHPMRDGDGVIYDFGADAPSNKIFDNIKYIAFRDSTSASGGTDSEYFYQQRWNSTTLDESPRVCDMLPSAEEVDSPTSKLRERLFELFKIEKIYDKKLVLLSSGEMRKFQITKALLNAPQLIILDNPFIGLDAATRSTLHTLMGDLAAMGDVQIIVVLSKTDDIPKFITHVIELDQREVKSKRTLDEYYATAEPLPSKLLPEALRRKIEELPTQEVESEMVVELRKVSIKYGERTILKALDWQVRRGERWALSGENGAGKSTLLSLVCADNPQGYACDIALFGRDRGTGESIWDIKRNIGYVSPEMHRAYLLPNRAIEIVASGLHDTIGLNRKMQPEQAGVCRFWMEVFGVEGLEDRLFTQLSSGEQRLLLLARAFVKDPALVILDEPLHGLDMKNRRRVTEIIEAFSQRPNKSMIMVTHYPEELPSTITNSLHLIRN